MLPILSVTGIFISLFLLVFKAREYRTIAYFSFYFLFLNLYALTQYVLLHSKSVFLVAIFCTHFTFLFYLIGPMLYWYIRSILTDNSSLGKRDLLHLLPMVIYLTAAIPYIITPWSHKIQIANEIINDPGFLGTYNFTILSEILSPTFVYLSRVFLVLIYTLWSFGLFIRYLMNKEDDYIFSGQHFMTKWLTFFLGFQFVLVTCSFIAIFETFIQSSDVLLTLNWLQFLSITCLAVLIVSPIFFHSVLYGLPRFPESITHHHSETEYPGSEKA
jgi:hypothetical protein